MEKKRLTYVKPIITTTAIELDDFIAASPYLNVRAMPWGYTSDDSDADTWSGANNDAVTITKWGQVNNTDDSDVWN